MSGGGRYTLLTHQERDPRIPFLNPSLGLVAFGTAAGSKKIGFPHLPRTQS
jgi:hypothetical protein